MYKEMTLRQFQKQYKNGAFSDPSRETQLKAGWTDWFCPNSELAERLHVIWETLLQHVTDSFILDKFYVKFRNCCPCDAPTYDEVSFYPCDKDKHDTEEFAISIDSPHASGKYAVYSARNYDEIETEFDTAEDAINFINTWKQALKKWLPQSHWL